MRHQQTAPGGASPLSLADFEGGWRIVRRIESEGGVSEFRGAAVLTPRGGGHLWAESGRLRMPDGRVLGAERRYLWREGAGGIEVLFEDGRPFHPIRQDGGEVVHDCPPDTYRGAYEFRAFPVWSLRWRVTGPRKDYVSTAVHRRLAPSAPSRDTASNHA